MDERIKEIMKVMTEHGLGSIVFQLGMSWRLPFLHRFFTNKKPENIPVKIRESAEELGGAFVKLIQFLSLRPDLVTNEYAKEFSKLLDKVPPFDNPERAIEHELKQPLKKLFVEFNKKPIGSASVAQVHEAKLHNGTKVVIKVQRPNAAEIFSKDIKILYYIAHKLKRFKIPYDVGEVIKEFESYSRKELNFVHEARAIQKFSEHDDGVRAPKVYWEYTTPRILTMEYIKGEKLDDILERPRKHDLKKIANNLAEVTIAMFFKTGFFHADMHPGNILVLPDEKIVLLDWGITGTISADTRNKALQFFQAIQQNNPKNAIDALLAVGIKNDETNLSQIQQELTEIINEWSSDTDAQRATHVMREIFTVCVRNGLRMPSELILLGKAAETVEGTIKLLNPEFDFVQYSLPRVKKLVFQEKKQFLKKAIQNYDVVLENISQIPRQTLETLRAISQGRVGIELKHTDIRHLGYDIELSSNRISYALIIASMLVSAALLAQVGPTIGKYPAITTFLIALAVLLAVPLTISIIREGTQIFDWHRK